MPSTATRREFFRFAFLAWFAAFWEPLVERLTRPRFDINEWLHLMFDNAASDRLHAASVRPSPTLAFLELDRQWSA